MFYAMRYSFLFALLLLTGCPQPASRPKTSSTPLSSKPAALNQVSDIELLKREWMLVEFAGFSRSTLTDSKAKLDLRNFPQAGLYLGCNQIGFKWPQDKTKRIDGNSMISTVMACVDMQLESSGSQFLLIATGYKIQGHELILSNDKGEVMRFIASDWD